MKKFLKIIRNIFVIILVLIAAWTLINQVLIRIDEKELTQCGKYVTVNESKMNVYSVGNGEKTIVLMPGLGTTAPVLDFEPLTNELATDFHVVIVEPFGYGWSDYTKNDRSVENIVEELRMALNESGEKGPYILMPHSVSGIYATWFANKYPEEVEAIVGIDCTLPKQVEYFGGENPKVPSIAKIVNPLGLQRLVCMVSPLTFISDNKADMYTEENLSQQKLLSSRVGFNKTIIDETNSIGRNIQETYTMTFDSAMPLLFFTRETNSQSDEKTKTSFYETYITNSEIQKVIVLDTGHYMHWDKANKIASNTKDFLISNR